MNVPKDEYSVFLKVLPRDETQDLEGLEMLLKYHFSQLTEAGMMRPARKKKAGIFGTLARITISGVTEKEYALIGMCPFCVETGEPKNCTPYKTIDDSACAAIQYFERHGYEARQVALKEFLDEA